jgi:hypothetical protein
VNILGTIASQFSGKSFGSFESIATVTVGAGGQSTITFSSIPSTFTHLQLRAIVRTNAAGSVTDIAKIQFNGDTGANYTYHTIFGAGSSVVADAAINLNQSYLNRTTTNSATADTFGAMIVDVLDYANTNKFKTIRDLGGADNNSTGLVYFTSGLWRSTSAITSFTLNSLDGTGFVQHTQFALYGIKGA